MVKKSIIFLTTAFILVSIISLYPAVEVNAETETVVNEDINKAVGNLDIPGTTTVNGDVSLNLGELKISGVVNGNVNSNMGQVTIDGDVNGDVETNMGKVIINGNVGGNVRARMGEVIVDGSVGGTMYSEMGAIEIDGMVGGDVESGVGDLRISGVIAGDVNSKAGSVYINGIVEGDVFLDQGVVELGPEALVSGKIYIRRGLVKKSETSIVDSIEIGEELSVSELDDPLPVNGYHFDGLDRDFGDRIADQVVGAVNEAMDDIRFMPHTIRGRDWFYSPTPFMGIYGSIARGVINMLLMFALAALTYSIFPKHVKAAGEAVVDKTGPVIGWGILATLLAVPLMIMLAITIIGIPLILIEIIFLAAAAILGYTGIVNLVGKRVVGSISSGMVNPLGTIAIGVLIIGLVSMIPLLGSLVSLAAFILAVGAALVTRFGTLPPAETVSLPIDNPE